MADMILQKQKSKTGSNHDISTELQVCRDSDHFHREALLGGEHEFDIEKHKPIASDEDRNFDSDDESLNSVGELQLDNEYTEDESEHIDLNKQDLQQDAISKEKTRGPTMLHHVHMRTFERRKAIILNEFGQPIGPISEEEDTLSEFSRFLGTIARDYSYAPLVFDSWRNVPNKDKMWEYVLGKYIIPDEGKDWVLKSIGAAWRIYKCRFKAKHYYSYKDDKSRWKNRSKRVPDEDFIKLLATWKKKSEKVRCSRNRDRRLSQKNMHTAGPKSFARIREEMKSEHPNKEPPSLAELFERTRKRNDGKSYKESYQDTARKIDDMKNYASPEDGNGPSDAFLGVMGKDYNGRCRLYGRGVCNKKLKKVSGGTTSSYVVPGDIIESLKDTMRKDLECEFDRLQAMRREIEEAHLKKKAELENMQRDLDNDRGRMAEQVMRKVLEKLPEDIARLYFS